MHRCVDLRVKMQQAAVAADEQDEAKAMSAEEDPLQCKRWSSDAPKGTRIYPGPTP